MRENVRFLPQTVAWWSRLMAVGQRPGHVHRWLAAEHGPSDTVLEQHSTDTLVLCLNGAIRIEDGRSRLDLTAGDAVVIRPGAWHQHAPLRPGTLVYQQGVLAGRSDFFLEDPGLRMFASWPEQPAWRLMTAVGACPVEAERRQRLRELFAHLATESAGPLPTSHPATLAMEYALWQNLHRPDCVDRVIAAGGMARAQSYRLFRASWGCGVATAVRRSRLALARELLADGMPLRDVVMRSGIRDRSVFSRAFRRQWGIAPSQV
jgi:AraC-like DNA-binding protein